MRRILASAAVILAAGAFLFLTLGSSSGGAGSTYKIELDNAFGLVSGADFKVGGVIAGSITKIDLCSADRSAHCTNPLNAVVTVQVSKQGFGQFHSDAFCQSRPQSLIGEYFLDCDPGKNGQALKAGSTIPVTHTQSTIPADLVQNIMRLPYRQRFSIIINELGAAVASRSEDLQSALKRADPALAETDNLLALLANDAQTIKQLNVNADSVITALAKNNQDVQRFIVKANNLSTDSATQAPNITRTWDKLPGFLEQLKPAMQKLGAASDAQDPVFQNLNAAANNLRTFFHELVPFSNQSRVSLVCGDEGLSGCPGGGSSLGSVSVTGKPAIKAATPTVRDLNNFAKPVPELAQNLSIVLRALDTRTRTSYAGGAAEPDPRSPAGGKGYTGLEALLQYVYNQTLAINYFGPWGHLLGVDAFANSTCSPYATPRTIAQSLAQYQAGQSQANPRQCYAFLGPNQPGVNETDPSNPSACVPDPGGAPVTGGGNYGVTYYGPKTNACKLQPTGLTPQGSSGSGNPLLGSNAAPGGAGNSGSSGSSGSGPNLQQTLGQIMSSVAGATGNAPATSAPSSPSAGAANTPAAGAGSSSTGGQTQQLLNYLLAP
jgi:ABC-type transporter Mla subunit MlaD